MASVNKVILVGNLGRDPEIRYSPDGNAICNLSLATTYGWRDRNSGERRENTEWHRVVLFNRLAEIAGEYLRKGRAVYIEGRLQTRKWQDKDTGQDRYTTEIVAEQMQMLGGRDSDTGYADGPGASRSGQSYSSAGQSAERSGPGPAASPVAPPQDGGLTDLDDDIPF